MIKFIIATFCILFGVHQQVLACGEIVPNARVITIVQRLAYKDFPKTADILAHIRVESSFNPKARNKSEREDSVGLMQVQNGPEDEHTNIAMGVSLLREYYEITHSKEGASKAYNIGIGNYRRGKLLVSAAEYYEKIKLWKKVYADYPKKMHYLGRDLGCKHIIKLQSRTNRELGITLTLSSNLGGVT